MAITHTVRVEHDGIVRNYGCESRFDAIVLMDALWSSRKFDNAQTWQGATLVAEWKKDL